jgi:endonuclease YncB( thermonuclease family)
LLFDSSARCVLMGVIAASLELSAGGSSAQDVQDGDTIEIQGQLACLYGIDAFELGQTCTDATGRTWRCGVAAKATLATLIRDQVLQCLVIEEDPNGCYQSRCMREDGADLGASMVRSGLALAKSDAYMAEETDAMRRRAGAWDGEFLPPWRWRSEAH